MAWGEQPDGDPYASRRHSSRSTTTDASASASGSEHSGASSPISIVPAQLSPTPFGYPTSLASLDDHYGSSGRLRDGPLHDLLPAFASASLSGSSSSGTRPSLGSWTADVLGPRAGPTARRAVSSPSPNPFSAFAPPGSSSPRSPLSGGAGFTARDGRDHSPSARPRPRQSLPAPPPTALGLSPASLLPSPKSHRRRSLTLSSSFGSPGTPFGSLVGSYEQSLLTGRMSALPSHPLPFLAAIGVLGAPDAAPRLRCPPHLAVRFEAFFYAGPEGTHHGASPYVGTIDLEAAYLAQLAAASPPTDAPPSLAADCGLESVRAPRFPGYRVPRRGQVQIIVKNPNSTAIKLFLVPYDLSGLDRGGLGGKTFLRQKSYTVAGAGADIDGSGRLRYAVHLQFCSPPATLRPGATSSAPVEPTYYLHQTIRVVFASRALDAAEKLRVVAEGPHGVVLDQEPYSPAQFMAYKGPGPEWEMARRKARGRDQVRRVAAAPSFPTRTSQPPLPPLSSLSLSYLASPPSVATPLSFDRPTSPRAPPPRSAVSALSSSRPTSPRLFGGRELEGPPPPPVVKTRSVPDAGR